MRSSPRELGIECLDKLKEAMKERIAQDYAQMGRAKLKRAILDKLDELHSFDLPQGMVEAEFNRSGRRCTANLEEEMKAENKTEEELKADYRQDRRAARAPWPRARRDRPARRGADDAGRDLARRSPSRRAACPGKSSRSISSIARTRGALDQLRAPLFEDKVIDFISEMATVENKPVSKDELMKEMEGLDEGTASVHSGHDHAHGHDHDHDHDHDDDHDHGDHDHAHDHDDDHDHGDHDHAHEQAAEPEADKPKPKPRAKKKTK